MAVTSSDALGPGPRAAPCVPPGIDEIPECKMHFKNKNTNAALSAAPSAHLASH